MTLVSNDTGWIKDASNPILGPSPLPWDSLVAYAGVPLHVNGDEYLFYTGASDHRWHMSIGLAINGVKQGMIIDRASVGYGGANKGIMAFDVIEIDGTYWMYIVAFNGATGFYRICTMRSTDLVSWSDFVDTGLDGHGPCVMEDPSDSSKLIVYYTHIGTKMSIRRASVNKSNLNLLTPTGTALSESGVNLVYPRSVWNGSYYELLFAKQVNTSPSQYRICKSASRDGLSFPVSDLVALPFGGVSDWDGGYVTVPRLSNGQLYFTARKYNEPDLYEGIGRCDWGSIGSLVEWDYANGNVSPTTDFAYDGAYGIKLVGGAESPRLVKLGEGKGKRYRVRIYDNLSTAANFQNTWRLFEPDGLSDVVLGLWMGASTSKYIYRTKGGSWTATSINRSVGWHILDFEVDVSEVRLKIDGVLVATDTNFNVDNLDVASLNGYTGGTGYADTCEITSL